MGWRVHANAIGNNENGLSALSPSRGGNLNPSATVAEFFKALTLAKYPVPMNLKPVGEFAESGVTE